MNGVCSTYEKQKKCIKDLGGKTCGKETAWKTGEVLRGFGWEDLRERDRLENRRGT
jgi:hypothetical protein